MLDRPKSERRQLTAIVSVRFLPDELEELRREADRRGISVPELLRIGTKYALAEAS
jgi:hypothetical protein